MEWTFGERFNQVTLGVVAPISVDEARERHESKKSYAAVLRADDRTIVGLDLPLGRPSVHVRFYDELGRTTLLYGFRPSHTPKKLFLGESRIFEYSDPESSTADVIEVMFCKEDGQIYHELIDRPNNKHVEWEGVQPAETLTLCYEPVPNFGDFASILRIERDRPVAEQPAGSPAITAPRLN